MFFSERFNVSKEKIKSYGAIDLLLECDLPLFIDPMLIFASNKTSYQSLYHEIVKYFAFLSTKADQGFTDDDIGKYFLFPEIKNNWLGYAKTSNGGRGLGINFANFLSKNIKFLMNTNNISLSPHIEKVLLLYQGNGKDKISDLMTNLIIDFLATYTEDFAKENISPEKIDSFWIHKAFFDYEHDVWKDKQYRLPFIEKNGKHEYVLLTPFDILRKEEPEICTRNFHKNWELIFNELKNIPDAVVNEELRSNFINSIETEIQHFQTWLSRQTEEVRRKNNLSKKKEEIFFKYVSKTEFYWVFDYYIKYVESNKDEIVAKSKYERSIQISTFVDNSSKLKDQLVNYVFDETTSAREECVKRISFFKHVIEDQEGYKCFYNGDEPITNEDTLHRFFRFVLIGTQFDYNFDGNNGNGEYDIKVSRGANDVCLAEFKLAKNKKLSHIFDQVEVYERANNAHNSIYVIFYFNDKEKDKIQNLLETNQNFIDHRESIFLINCKNDRIPASRV